MIKIDFTHTQSHSITISNEQRNKKYLITRLILEKKQSTAKLIFPVSIRESRMKENILFIIY
jgi:hypothetical protein